MIVPPRPPWRHAPSQPSPPSPTLMSMEGTVRASHLEYTPEQWEAVRASRWHEYIVNDANHRTAFRCTSETAEREGAVVTRAHAEVRLLYTGVMRRDRLKEKQ